MPGPSEGAETMANREPTELIEKTEPELRAAADALAARDAAAHLAPGIASPTPGEAELAAMGAMAAASLRRAQQSKASRDHATLTSNQQVIAAHASGDEVVVPDTVPLRRVLPVEFLVIAIAGFIETLALRGPVGTALDLPMQGADRWFIPMIVALATAVLAHVSGKHAVEARQSRVPALQDAERRLGRMYALGVLAACAIGVIARYLAAQFDENVVTVTPQEYAFFIAFQFTFAACALALARSYHSRVAAMKNSRARAYLVGLAAQNVELEQCLRDTPATHASECVQLDAAIDAAGRHYRYELQAQHPDVEAQLGWASRSAREVADGSLARALGIDPRNVATTDAPHVVNDETEPEEPPGGAEQPPSAHVVPDEEDDDLFDRIVNPGNQP